MKLKMIKLFLLLSLAVPMHQALANDTQNNADINALDNEVQDDFVYLDETTGEIIEIADQTRSGCCPSSCSSSCSNSCSSKCCKSKRICRLCVSSLSVCRLFVNHIEYSNLTTLADALRANGLIGATGATGDAGTTGATGATGATGDAGAPGGLSAYGYIYNTDTVTIAVEQPILFDTNGPSSLIGLTHIAGSSDIVVTNAGTYSIFFSVSGTQPNQFALFVDSGSGPVVAPSTVYGSGAGTQQNTGLAILTLGAGDVLSLRNHTSDTPPPGDVTLTNPIGGTQTVANASILIQRLA